MKKLINYKKYIITAAFVLCGIFYSCYRMSASSVNTGDVIMAAGGTEGNSSVTSAGADMADVTDAEGTQQPEKDDAVSRTDETHDTQGDDRIYVYVCGNVVSPGVYRCNPDERVYAVIDMAGGFTGSADRNYLNLVERVTDGQRIYVPAIGEPQDSIAGNSGQSIKEHDSSSGSGSTLININTATNEQLQTLPGIGASRAADIINYREENGRFKSIDEIKNVSGIKDSLYKKIKDLICI